LANKEEYQNSFYCVLNGKQYFGKIELFCEVDAVLSACIVKWLVEEKKGE
jgi:hypothetical protein